MVIISKWMINTPRQKIWTELSIIRRFIVNVMTFTIKQQLINNSVMMITRNDCHVTQLISCWLFKNLFHNRSFYLFLILNNMVHYNFIVSVDTCFCFSSDLNIIVYFCAICYYYAGVSIYFGMKNISNFLTF